MVTGHVTPNLTLAFKRSQQSAGPDQREELLGLWHQARCSLQKSRQHLLNEAEDLLHALPEAIRDRLPAGKPVEPRLLASATLTEGCPAKPGTLRLGCACASLASMPMPSPN